MEGFTEKNSYNVFLIKNILQDDNNDKERGESRMKHDVNNNDWTELLITQKTKTFQNVQSQQRPPVKKRKKKNKTIGTIIMATLTLLAVSTTLVFTVIFITKRIEYRKLENSFNEVNQPYTELVEEKTNAASELAKIKTEAENLKKQIDDLRD